jgi:energy-coupling factor transporter ATP-binding protein EcfA2
MLKKIYIDNYKIFVNFSLELAPVNLLLGENGSGKTTLLEVIRKLKTFVIDRKEVTEIFKSSSVTRWQTVNLQRFEMTFEEADGVYVYHCHIEHDKSQQRCRLHSERLDYNQQPLFEFYLQETAGQIQSHAKLYNDQHCEGPELPFDWSQSGVGYIQARPDNQKLTRFKEILSRCLVVQIVPVNLTAVSDYECNAFPVDHFM